MRARPHPWPARLRAAALLLACAGLPAYAANAPLVPLSPPSMPDGFMRRIIAEVGGRGVTMDAAFETWGPIWEELADQALRGKISPEKFDAELQREWRKAVDAAVKDELFYREALFTLERLKARMVEQYERQTGGQVPRPALERQVDKTLDEDLRKQLDRVVRAATKAAGGASSLQRHLARRGIAMADWQARLRRKAYTAFYFSLYEKPSSRSPTPQRIRDYYARHKDTEFMRPGRVEFRHIFFDARRRGGVEAAQAAAVDCWQRIVTGQTTFAQAVAADSDDPVSAARGGHEDGTPDTTRPERELWLAQLRAAAREEAPGEMSGLLESDDGFHLVEAVRVWPATPAPFSDVQDELRERIAAEDQQRDTDQIFTRLAKDVPVRVLMERFPPECAFANLDTAAAPGARPTVKRLY